MEEKKAEGVKELCDVLDLVVDAVDVAVSAKADGHVGLEDLGLLLKLVPDLGPAVAGLSKVPAELLDLSAAEGADVVAHVMARLAVEDAKARAVIAASLKLVAAGMEMVGALRS